MSSSGCNQTVHICGFQVIEDFVFSELTMYDALKVDHFEKQRIAHLYILMLFIVMNKWTSIPSYLKTPMFSLQLINDKKYIEIKERKRHLPDSCL